MATIDTSYFTGLLAIAQISNAAVALTVNQLIEKLEPELLERLMGYALYKAYKDGTAASTQKYMDIRDGKEYTGADGTLQKWPGLKFTNGSGETAVKSSLIANYVYWHYIRDNHSFTTGGGQKKTDLAVNVAPDAKLVRAWNEMVKWNIALYEFLSANAADYPEFNSTVIDMELFTFQNTLNL